MNSILTWYKALNHGAVLQAYASQQFLLSYSIDNEIMDYNRKVISPSALIRGKNLIRKLGNGSILYRKEILKFDNDKLEIFDKFRNKHLLMSSHSFEKKYDYVMVGSDMVFNLRQGYNPYMFGEGVKADHIFSYAACAGGSSLKTANKMGVSDSIRKGLMRFSGIGYRDKQTASFVQQISGRTDIVYNIDPVLLYGFKNELIDWDSGYWIKHKPYILLYSYHNCFDSKSEINEIKRFAKDKNLKIVSCGYYHPWCDECINAAPDEFLEMYKHSKYIVTDTFHGTVFSLICKKPFVARSRNNEYKLQDLLIRCRLNDSIAKTTSDIRIILNKPTEYSYFEKWLKHQRIQSSKYLLNQFGQRLKEDAL